MNNIDAITNLYGRRESNFLSGQAPPCLFSAPAERRRFALMIHERIRQARPLQRRVLMLVRYFPSFTAKPAKRIFLCRSWTTSSKMCRPGSGKPAENFWSFCTMHHRNASPARRSSRNSIKEITSGKRSSSIPRRTFACPPMYSFRRKANSQPRPWSPCTITADSTYGARRN